MTLMHRRPLRCRHVATAKLDRLAGLRARAGLASTPLGLDVFRGWVVSCDDLMALYIYWRLAGLGNAMGPSWSILYLILPDLEQATLSQCPYPLPSSDFPDYHPLLVLEHEPEQVIPQVLGRHGDTPAARRPGPILPEAKDSSDSSSKVRLGDAQ